MSAQSRTTEQCRPRPGRPRDASLDGRVLVAARALLAEVGFDATTVEAIAARSGVHTSAIYRRWPTRTAIIEQAVFPGLDPIVVAPTGALEPDVRRFVRAYHAALRDPALRAALPSLLRASERSERDGVAETWLAVSARPLFRDILQASPPGSVADAVDPDDVFDVLQGALLARVLVPTVIARSRPLERLVELVIRMIAEPTAPDLSSRASKARVGGDE